MKNIENKTGKGKLVSVIAVAAVLAIGGIFLTVNNNEAIGGKGDKADKADKAAAAAPAEAEQPAIKMGNPTVANVNGEEIKRSDVLNFISTLPEQVRQMPIQNLFPLALEQVVNNKVVGSKAVAAKLDADPEVTTLVEQARGQIIRNVYVERQVNEGVSQKKLLKAYEDLLGTLEDVQETHARHILVDTEEKAREVITKLDGGAKFEDLAKEMSTGPSKENGGDLGYFAKNEMVPEFADAAFAIEPGKYSKDPVKTQFGWHVVKVEDRRKRAEPKFEDVKPQLEQQMRQKILTDLLGKWQKEAKIQKFDINGDPVKAN